MAIEARGPIHLDTSRSQSLHHAYTEEIVVIKKEPEETLARDLKF
jgi:hypothetical protein